MANTGDCCAIIMAAGSGSRMTDLTNQCPKALLPVGRFPMIWYPIRSLEKAGFSDIVIITRKSWEKQMHSILSDKSVPILARLEIVSIPDSEDLGTADSLRRVAPKVKTTALVVSCDLISDCDLTDFMSVHRKHNSSITVMLSQLPTSIVAETLVPGFKSKQKNAASEKISIGFESNNEDHILFWRSQIDMDSEYLSLSKRFLDRFPCTRIQSKWTDCHVYMINKFVIEYLINRSDINSLQGELLPQVVKKQMSTLVKDKSHEEADMTTTEEADMTSADADNKPEKRKDLIDYVAGCEFDLTREANFLSLTSSNFGASPDSPQKDLIRCYAYRQTAGFCVRANTIAAYFEACKQIPRLMLQFLDNKSKGTMPPVPESTSIKPKSQVGADCLLGENVEIGEKVSIKKSVIGRHCKIDDKVKITNSIIMDHVTILESSNISNCIICDSAKIGDKCELNSCIVGQKQSISTMSKHANEALSSVTQMMEVALE
ncbi:translation initiation factor eIF-2B subunit gamma [Aplysia californica]|uniref:Translation initiation factor eIF2B subunit gamma n=1 Tax=Aplysia californica TaxID=6500 RepID=A0ABM0JUI6_APLCA|nr:translation initiation factor eIF-2B subunit gamma [Aplysia californica]